MNKIFVNCVENKNIEVTNEVTHTCGSTFELDKSEVYTYETVDHFSEIVRNYYTICPTCGHLIILNEERLTKEMKEMALQKSDNDPLLLKKNILRAQLIYLESITPKVKARTRIKW